MKSIPEIICCGLVLAVMQSAIAADTTAASAAPATHSAEKKPAKVTVDRDQLRKRLEDRGIQKNKRSDLARQKAAERQNAEPAAGN
jgi:hypothetical protein